MVIKCPPPIPVECASIIPIQNKVAIADSTALPPCNRISLKSCKTICAKKKKKKEY